MTQNRVLGNLEKKALPPYLCNIVVPTLITLKEPVNENLLEEAIYVFIKCQPNLNAAVRKTNDGILSFYPLEDIKDYFEVLPSNTPWKSICLKYSNTLLHEDHENNCPIKVFFVPVSNTKAYLIPVYAHYCADGTNGMTIVNDILLNYQQLRRGVPLKIVPISPPPSVDEMIQSAMPSLEEKETVRSQYIREFEDKCNRFNNMIPFEDAHVTEALYYTSTEVVCDVFIETCRSHDVTVGSALMAAMFFGLAGYMFEFTEDCDDNLYIGIDIPINLRGRTPSDVPDNCCNLSIVQYLLSVDLTKSRAFWELARAIRKDFVAVFSKNYHLFDFSLMKETKPLMEIPKKKFGLKHQASVSNMRRFPGSPNYDEFRIDSIHCVGGLWLRDRDLMELMVYSTDKLNLSMIHRAGDVNTRRADIVFMYVRYIVENCQQLNESFDVQKCMEDYKAIDSLMAS